MTEHKAKRIEKLRCGNPCHSWRRISEIICDEYSDESEELRGNQLHGQELCIEAMEFLYGPWIKISDEIKNNWY